MPARQLTMFDAMLHPTVTPQPVVTGKRARPKPATGRAAWPTPDWPEPWPTRHQAYLDHLRARNLAAKTVSEYGRDVEQCLAFLAGRNRLRALPDTADLTAWLAHLQQQGARGHTLERKRAALRSFFGWLRGTGQVATDPARRLLAPTTTDYHLPPTLSETEVQALLRAACDHVLNQAILSVLVHCGLRVGELVGLMLPLGPLATICASFFSAAERVFLMALRYCPRTC